MQVTPPKIQKDNVTTAFWKGFAKLTKKQKLALKVDRQKAEINFKKLIKN